MSTEFAMVTVSRKYKHVVVEKDRHGKRRTYFRVDHGPRIAFPVRLGTKEADDLYDELLRKHEAGELKKAPQGLPTPNTLRWLGLLYTTSTEFKQHDPRTQHVTRLILESIYREPIRPNAQETFGDCPLSRFGIQAVGIVVDRKAATPEAANNRLKRVRAMFSWAMQRKYAHLGVTENPARDVPKLKPKRKGGFPVWKPADLDKFEACHPIGTQARLALSLMMFTGASRSDVVRLGPPMVHDGVLNFVRWKGRNNNPVEVHLKIIGELRAIIDATPVVGTTAWLVTKYGHPFTAAGFGNKFHDWCEQAGVRVERQLSAHGVRKAAATRMADRGASAHTLMATFAWLDIKQAEHYTREAERKRLGIQHAHLLGTNRVEEIPNLGNANTTVRENEAKKRG